MSSAGEWEEGIDPMLFFAAVIEDQMDVLDMTKEAGAMFHGVPSLAEGVADVAREQIASAQAKLDEMIEADRTWRPAAWSDQWCSMVLDGHDTNGDEWNRCIVHDELVLGDAYVCEGYIAPPYTGGH